MVVCENIVVAKKKRYAKKRKCPGGNKWTKLKEQKVTTKTEDTGGSAVVDESSTLGNTNVIANTSSASISNDKEAANTSSSAKKINLSYYAEHGGESSVTNNTNIAVENTSCLYMVLDVNILLNMLQLVGHCPECQHQIVPGIDFSLKKGLAQMIVLKCKNDSCAWEYTQPLKWINQDVMM